MKHLSFLFILICMAAGISRSATVSGTLSYAGSAPAGSQTVYLIDSSGGNIVHMDTTVTNASGGYSFNIPSAFSSGNIRLFTFTCGYYYQTGFTPYSGSNLTINVTLPCGQPTISGILSYSFWGTTAPQKVYLVDTATTGGIVFRDSVFTNTSGAYSFNVPPTVATGLMRVYAFGCNTSVSSSYTYYYGSSLTINLSLPCVPAVITDTVKNSTSGAFVYGQKVYLTSNSTTPVYKDSAYTNKQGAVQFLVSPSVSSGTFTVSTNACGLQSQSVSFSGASITAPTLYVCVSSAIVSGTLTNVSTSAAIPYYPVVLVDSSATALLHYDSLYTNASGFYSVILPVGLATGTITVKTMACGVRAANSAAFSGSNLMLNLSACATSSATISGTLTNATTSAAVSGQKVYLLDSVSASFVYRDSTITNSSGGYSFVIPPTIATGMFRISTASCGVQQYQYVYYSGSSVVMNWSVYAGPTSTFTGIVRDNTGAAVSGATVQIQGAASGPTTTTGASGTYSLTFPCNWPLGTFALIISHPSACSTIYRNFNYTGSNLSSIDTICQYRIGGAVSLQVGGAAVGAKVWLIREDYDTTGGVIDTNLIAMDSTTTNSSGQYKFNLPYIWSVPQRVKAALPSTHPSYANYLPTYHDSALIWSSAQIFNYIAWINNNMSLNISLRGGTNPGGPGFIGGSVLLGANKQAGIGDPLPGRILMLTNAAGKAVAYTYSNGTGKFSFSNLPYGSYYIFGDVWGKRNPALAVTLTAAAPGVTAVVFEENSEHFEGHLRATGISGPAALDALSIYPNPVKDYVAINGLSAIGSAKTAVLRNATGAVAGTYTIAAGVNTIPAKGLPAGLYLLQLQTAEGVAAFRFVKE